MQLQTGYHVAVSCYTLSLKVTRLGRLGDAVGNINRSSGRQSWLAVSLQSQCLSVCTANNLVPCVRWSSAYPISPKVGTKR